MYDPFLYRDRQAVWRCFWTLNDHDNVFAQASSNDLIQWGRQYYPETTLGKTVTVLAVRRETNNQYAIDYKDSAGEYFVASTSDFKTYNFKKSPIVADSRKEVSINGAVLRGQIHRVAWSEVNALLQHVEIVQARHKLYRENSSMYGTLFPDLKTVTGSISLEPNRRKEISDLLVGVFFEDINYAADGGLYAELIQNRDFEYSLSDREGRDKSWNAMHSWSSTGGVNVIIDTTHYIHINNKHHALVNVGSAGALRNTGFDGIVLRKGQTYEFSCFSKLMNGKVVQANVKLVRPNGEVLATQKLSVSTVKWKQQSLVLKATADEDKASFEIEFTTPGVVALDMISVFPQNTFKGRKNGLRADLANVIADLHPRFIRFPGGCVAHGDGVHNIYHWKNTIGPLEARKPQRNLWGYHQTAGLGYLEYFQFCEDVGAEPVPVVAAGVPCQNSVGGQQGGIPESEMDSYVQDILDLIEFANGDGKTTWGKKRIALGHPKPFNLKYIGIGNEDLITDVFEARFVKIHEAVKRKYPDITVIGTVGPFYQGTDYVEGWKLADQLRLEMVDEHYYESPGWFIYNQDFYDRYDRSKSKVYLGEYASHLPGRPNNLETALSEAIYLTALERNGDVVTMASYAPLLAKEGHTQWNPDMIYFNNQSVTTTPGYEVQRMFSVHGGNEYISSNTVIDHRDNAVMKRIGTSVVYDRKTGDVIIKVVNLLPVQCDLKINLNELLMGEVPAKLITLTGEPGEKNLRPQEKDIRLSRDRVYAFPPYSLSVIRYRTSVVNK
ncbi:alpha-L-arabinofuranosidase [Pseudochryseolinea flava]|uniref:non-reducing end alpha-L-arabinofuranosidase n=2 Tax=Pseudochryseolinea flava TaxID=2059302 RepID=A0A364Y7R2_9BACT|nr:alpha-L-arabinofuranosidase [Pseudochryseolinea flava]